MPVGGACALGATQLRFGADFDDDGSLTGVEIAAETFVCIGEAPEGRRIESNTDDGTQSLICGDESVVLGGSEGDHTIELLDGRIVRST